jgi:hypothetical protein
LHFGVSRNAYCRSAIFHIGFSQYCIKKAGMKAGFLFMWGNFYLAFLGLSFLPFNTSTNSVIIVIALAPKSTRVSCGLNSGASARVRLIFTTCSLPSAIVTFTYTICEPS